MVTFQDNVTIDSKIYENPTGKIINHLKEGKFKTFFIKEYIETKNVDLRLNNFNILTPLKQEINNNPIWWSITIIALMTLLVYFVYKFFIYITSQIQLKNSKEKEENLLRLSNQINHLTALYSKTGRFDLEVGELTPPLTHST